MKVNTSNKEQGAFSHASAVGGTQSAVEFMKEHGKAKVTDIVGFCRPTDHITQNEYDTVIAPNFRRFLERRNIKTTGFNAFRFGVKAEEREAADRRDEMERPDNIISAHFCKTEDEDQGNNYLEA